MYNVSNLSFGYRQNTPILDNISFSLKPGAITTIIGPNGCGKTTLLKTLARLIPPQTGEIHFKGQSLLKIPSKTFAQQVALLPQMPAMPDDFTVYDLIALGRFPYQNWLGRLHKEDHEIINRSIELTGLENLVHRMVSSLSGGERQRSYIAMALSQKPEVFLMDEPITYLDIHHQLEVMELLSHLNLKLGLTIVIVLHNLDLALRYAHEVIVLHNHTIHAQGPPEEVITSALCEEVFQVDARFIQTKDIPHKVFIPFRMSQTPGRHLQNK